MLTLKKVAIAVYDLHSVLMIFRPEAYGEFFTNFHDQFIKFAGHIFKFSLVV